MKRLAILGSLVAAVVGAGTSQSCANVWIDEDFDGAAAFVQGNGIQGGIPGATLDTYDVDATITNPITAVIAHTGTVVTSKSYDGAKSYRLNSGQSLTLGTPYDNQTNGNFLHLQLAVNVDPIPPAGTVGEIRWNFTMGTTPTDYSFFYRLVSTGTAINIVAGQDQPTTGSTTSSTVDTLTGVNNWTHLTMRMQKNEVAKTDSRFGDGAISQGMRFYSSTAVPQLTIPLAYASGGGDVTKNISITATGGTIYIDSLYFDGGCDDDAANSFPHAYNSPKHNSGTTSAADWSLFQ